MASSKYIDRKLYTPVIFFVLFFLAVQCQSKKEKKLASDEIYIDVSENSSAFSEKLVIKDLFFLEQSSQSLLDVIFKIELVNDSWFILAKNGLFKFTKKGQFINEIGKKGKGPGEFSSLKDFYIDKSNGDVNLLSTAPSRIIRYDAENNLLDETAIKIPATHLLPYAKDFSWFQVAPIKNNHYLHFTKGTESIKRKVRIFDESQQHVMTSMVHFHGGFKEYKDCFTINPTLSNEIYGIKGDDVWLKYTLNFQGKEPSYTEFISSNQTRVSSLNYAETENHLVLSFFYNKSKYVAVHSKGKSETNTFQAGFDELCEVFSVISLRSVVYSNGNSFFSLINYNDIQSWKKVFDIEQAQCLDGFTDYTTLKNKFLSTDLKQEIFMIVEFELKDI